MLDKGLVQEVLNEALKTGGDFAEIFVEDTQSTSILLLGGVVEESNSGRDYGVGIRIYYGLNSVYAYTNDSSKENLLRVAKTAAAAIKGTKGDLTINLTTSTIENTHFIKKLPNTISKKEKVDVMKRAYSVAKNYSPEITQVIVRYLDVDQKVLIANSEGLFVEDRRVRTRLPIEAIASKGSEKQSGFYGPGAQKGFEFFEEIDLDYYAKEAARIAVTMINAEHCPSGKMPVIIDNEFGGVIFHEACGHGLEATSVAKKTSVFADKLGELVASELVTAIDDGTIPNAWGSSNIDDEGMKTQKNILIENGILKGYMIDRLNSRRMGMAPTGNGRRQSYKFAPTSRMTNTYIAPGKSTPEEIISNTEYGLYAKYMGGGSVNPATGEFNFAVNEGYIIKNGKIHKPVRSATLIGRGIEVLKKIDMVGNNLGLGQGMCGSVSGSIPANVGQPMIRVSEMTVGGRKGE
ncbi:TldD protein [Anaerobranca californiensis DSM 14826]|jgi:TldD protein|uniref:TldD protein n=1 Tax=Anaerobranca californiensis DSM 14826 TaxID=1120989 RepID=A0A1M6P5T5_9FIRM|nr:TldD/PmbA family protein [Anaerobranca californiensis]SHK03359.1 TldD protein [Anaerobranca californiensis DSM 14826]